MQALNDSYYKYFYFCIYYQIVIAFFNKKIGTTSGKLYGIDLKSLSHEEMMKLTEFVETIPLTQDIINTLVSLGLSKLEELEEKNRRLYAERGWERYL